MDEQVSVLGQLAASIDDHPTVAQIDAMLRSMRGRPRTPRLAEVENSLLEMRELMMREPMAG